MTRLNWDRTEPSGEFPSGGVAAAPTTSANLFAGSWKDVVRQERAQLGAKKAKLTALRMSQG